MKYGVIFLFLLSMISCSGKDVESLYQSLPSQVQTFKAQGQDEFYDRETLYEYINGGAELYLAFDFKKVFVRRYTGPEGAELALDVYDMGRAAEAFGLFSVERADEDINIGQGSEYGGGLLRFWKDRYFVSIMSRGPEQKAKPVMFQLAQAVDGAIKSIGSEPGLVKMLPRDGLLENKVKYFHSAAILNRQYFLAEKNILKLGRRTECVLAEYKRGRHAGKLLLVRYPSDKAAKEALKQFLNVYLPEAKDSGCARMENKTWTMIKRQGSILAIALEAGRKEFAERLLADLKFMEG